MIQNTEPGSRTRSALAAICLVAFGLGSSCLMLDGSFRDRAMTSFRIMTASNPGLRMSRKATIYESENLIEMQLPDYLDLTSLVPEFTYKGAKVVVDGREQTSGVTRQDFSKPLVYSVVGKDDRTIEYRVAVEVVPASSKKSILIDSVGCTTPGSNYVSGMYSGRIQEYYYNIYYKYDLSRVYLGLSTDGVSISSMGREITLYDNSLDFSWTLPPNPSFNMIDFTNPVDFIVTAEDGTTASYTITITNNPVINSFSFRQSNNPSLGSDRWATIDYERRTIDVLVPAGTNRGSLIADYWIDGEGVSVEGVSQINSVTANDFTQDVYYTVLGLNGKNTVYRVRVTEAPAGSEASPRSLAAGP